MDDYSNRESRVRDKKAKPDPETGEIVLPKTEKISKNFGGTKEFTDLINPLYRFIERNIGRPWNKVFSEVSQVLKINNKQTHHLITTHLLSSIDFNPVLDDKQKVIIKARAYGYFEYWVHPITGLLGKYKKVSFRAKWKEKNRRTFTNTGYEWHRKHPTTGEYIKSGTALIVDSTRWIEKVNEAWALKTIVTTTIELQPIWSYDRSRILRNKEISHYEIRTKILSKKDHKKYGLS